MNTTTEAVRFDLDKAPVLRVYDVGMRLRVAAPTPELAQEAASRGLFQELAPGCWYGATDCGLIEGGELTDDVEEVGLSNWGDAEEVCTLFPTLCQADAVAE